MFVSLSGCVTLPNVQHAPSGDKFQQQASYHYLLSVFLRNDGNLDEAIRELEQAYAADPDSAYLVIELMSLYAQKGDVKSAVAHGEEALARDPDNVDVHLIMGGLYLNMREYSKAVREHKKVIELDPKNLVAHLYLGIIYAEEKRFDRAEETFKKMLKSIRITSWASIITGKFWRR
jgi:tetratricopeptide (TPR) repeat protein